MMPCRLASLVGRCGRMEVSMVTLDVRIVGRQLPGRQFCDYEPVYVGLGRGDTLRDLTPGDAPEAVFRFSVDVIDRDGQRDFRGLLVRGRRGERFVYLSWGTLAADGQFTLFRAAKLRLTDIPEPTLTHALATATPLEATLALTDAR